MSYTKFDEKKINTEDHESIIDSYNNGFVFTRVDTGVMHKVRSLRVDLALFKESSENRRILKKFEENIFMSLIPYEKYDFTLGKMLKDFYETKFGPKTFSANKAKQILTTQNNFNSLLKFSIYDTDDITNINGYVITHTTEGSKKIIHYAYPFYKLDLINTSFGMYMMTKSIDLFKELGFDYIYLGSVHDKSAFYKLQFSGLEWYDELNNLWSSELELLKERTLSSNI